MELKYGKSDFEKRHFAMLGLMCAYGIEIQEDNIAECRENMLEIFADYLRLDHADDLYRAAAYVLSVNIVHGDALKMLTWDKQPICFAEWSYLGRGKFKRRDFRLDELTNSSDPLFAYAGIKDVFAPDKRFLPATVADLAAAFLGHPLEEEP